jgi:hypothetical protein
LLDKQAGDAQEIYYSSKRVGIEHPWQLDREDVGELDERSRVRTATSRHGFSNPVGNFGGHIV